MKLRSAGGILVAVLLLATPAAAPKPPEIPQGLQETYGAFATALVEGRADEAVEFYAEDAVVLVDSEHVYRGRSAILQGFLRVYLQAPAGDGEGGPRTEIRVDGVVVGEGVVTLTGRYTNPAGASGIYGNTWQRQDDGSWKLAASVMTFEAADGAKASVRAGQDFACTQVLGFSQSLEWFGGLSLEAYTDGAGSVELTGLKQGVFLPAWQGRFFMGASVEEWMDPGYPGWSGSSARAHETPGHCAREEVDRVIFNVSGAARSADEWAAAVDSVARLVRAKFPGARRIVMQPVVGAPEGECREVRAARNHPEIAEGIRRAAERGAVTAGPEPKVAACDQFRDGLGHLTAEGAEHVRAVLRDRYRESTALLESESDSVGFAPELLRRSYTSAETGREREYFVYLPRGYHEAPPKDWPVLLFLHGSGERGDGREDLAWVMAHGPLYEAWIQKRDLPFIIVSPQLPVFGRTEQVEGRSAGRRGPPGVWRRGRRPATRSVPATARTRAESPPTGGPSSGPGAGPGPSSVPDPTSSNGCGRSGGTSTTHRRNGRRTAGSGWRRTSSRSSTTCSESSGPIPTVST